MNSDVLHLYDFFLNHNIKINPKMATALYAGVLNRYDAFMSDECDGTIFAFASALVALKADKKTCHDFLLNRLALSYMRLKEHLLKTLLLKEEATHAYVSVSDEDLKSSGGTLDDAYDIMKDFLKIVHIKRVTLLKSDENNTIIKEI